VKFCKLIESHEWVINMKFFLPVSISKLFHFEVLNFPAFCFTKMVITLVLIEIRELVLTPIENSKSGFFIWYVAQIVRAH
jgi:hypothetical protein